MMTAGLSFSEREALRDQYRQRAIAQAEKLGVTLRCRYLDYDLNDPGHQLCRGESPGGAGCLCRCHDHVITGSAELPASAGH
jgi:hypothetical protein